MSILRLSIETCRRGRSPLLCNNEDNQVLITGFLIKLATENGFLGPSVFINNHSALWDSLFSQIFRNSPKKEGRYRPLYYLLIGPNHCFFMNQSVFFCHLITLYVCSIVLSIMIFRDLFHLLSSFLSKFKETSVIIFLSIYSFFCLCVSLFKNC